MNVLMLCWEYPPNIIGGLGAHVGALAPRLADEGVRVHVVTPLLKGGPEEETIGNLSISRVPPTPSEGDFVNEVAATNSALFEKAAAIVGGDSGRWIVHGHDWLIGRSAAQLKEQFSLPFLATIHATEYGRNQGIHNDIQRRVHEEEYWLTYQADRIIACSRYMAGQIREVFRVPSDKLDVIPNGVDVAPFAHAPYDKEAFRAGYLLPDEKAVLYVGRLVAEKGIYVLLESIPRVLEIMPRAKFIVVGAGPALEDARFRASSEVWADRILFTGFVSEEERNRLYDIADAAAFPSIYEPFGIVALEAMAAGAPVVVTDGGGLGEVVEPNETGIVVEAGSADALAWGIVHVLEQPCVSRARAETAYQRAVTEFNWDVIAERTVAVYDRLLH